jgi:hypothetical protein
MKNLLLMPIQKKRQFFISELIKMGVFKKEDKHLYELTLHDLEEEYHKQMA